MRTLSLYFAKRYLSFFAAILFFASLALAVIEIALGFDSIQEPSQWLGWMMVRIPSYYLKDVAPIAAYLAALLSLGLAARWLEWSAAQAAGIAPWRIIAPIIGASLFLAAGTAVVRESLVPLIFEYEKTARTPVGEQLPIHPGFVSYHHGRTILEAEQGDPAKNQLYKVEVFVRSPRGRLESSYSAPTAHLQSDGSWLLRDVTIRDFFPNQPSRVPHIRTQDKLALTLADDPGLLFEQIQTEALPLPSLIRYIANNRESEYSGSRSRVRRLESVVHDRLAAPWLIVVMSLLAAPVALRVRPGHSLAPAAVTSVGLLASFFFVRSLSERLINQQLLPHIATVWAIPILFMLGASISLWATHRSIR